MGKIVTLSAQGNPVVFPVELHELKNQTICVPQEKNNNKNRLTSTINASQARQIEYHFWRSIHPVGRLPTSSADPQGRAFEMKVPMRSWELKRPNC